MSTASRGNGAEAAILAALVRRGFQVWIPFGSGHPYDLAVDLGDHILRVQCKRAWPVGGCLTFNARSTDHGHGRQSYVGLADLFGVYFPPNDSVYLIAVRDLPTAKGWLRLEPTLNNQRRRVRFAADYAIDRWTALRLRAVARVGDQEPTIA